MGGFYTSNSLVPMFMQYIPRENFLLIENAAVSFPPCMEVSVELFFTYKYFTASFHPVDFITVALWERILPSQSVYFISLNLLPTALSVDTVYCSVSSIKCTVCLASRNCLCLWNSVHLDPIQTLSFSKRSDAYRRCLRSFSVSYRKDFEELFDVIITNALKPGFFSLVPQQRPFRTLGECQPAALIPPAFAHLILKMV